MAFVKLNRDESIKAIGKNSGKFLAAIGMHMMTDIMNTFVMPPPSTRGGPPAVQTGNLRASQCWELNNGANSENGADPSGATVLRVGTKATAPYGLWLERPLDFNVSPKIYRPFLVPALDRMSGKLSQIGRI